MTTIPNSRDFLFHGGSGFGALALSDLLTAESRAAEQQNRNPLAPRPPHVPGTAKSVIFLFMQGGPSHLETFDHKPTLTKRHGEQVHLRRPTLHEQADHPLRSRREVRLRQHAGSCNGLCADRLTLGQQRRERQRADAGRRTAEELPASQRPK